MCADVGPVTTEDVTTGGILRPFARAHRTIDRAGVTMRIGGGALDGLNPEGGAHPQPQTQQTLQREGMGNATVVTMEPVGAPMGFLPLLGTFRRAALCPVLRHTRRHRASLFRSHRAPLPFHWSRTGGLSGARLTAAAPCFQFWKHPEDPSKFRLQFRRSCGGAGTRIPSQIEFGHRAILTFVGPRRQRGDRTSYTWRHVNRRSQHTEAPRHRGKCHG